MKRLFFALLLFSLFWLKTELSQATVIGDAVREIDKASVLITTKCEYIFKLKEAGSATVTKRAVFMGNGFFIEHQSAPHLVATARHVVSCQQTPPDRFFDDKFKLEQAASFKVNVFVSINYKGTNFPATVTLRDFNDNPEIDLVFMEVILPQGFAHGHNPVLTDAGSYDIGTEVIVRGFMPAGGGAWLMRLKVTKLENIAEKALLLQLNTPAYSGMSGSPILLWKDGRYFVIGILIIKFESEEEGVHDVSFATLFKKEYFDMPSGK